MRESDAHDEIPEFFLEYESQFHELRAKIAHETVRLVARGADAPADLSAAADAVAENFGQAESLIKTLSVEARTAPSSVQRPLLDRTEAYRKGLRALRTEFERAREDSARHELVGGMHDDDEDEHGDEVGEEREPVELSIRASTREDQRGDEAAAQQQRLLAANDSLERQSAALNRSMAALEETEAVALEITGELGRHREKIKVG